MQLTVKQSVEALTGLVLLSSSVRLKASSTAEATSEVNSAYARGARGRGAACVARTFCWKQPFNVKKPSARRSRQPCPYRRLPDRKWHSLSVRPLMRLNSCKPAGRAWQAILRTC